MMPTRRMILGTGLATASLPAVARAMPRAAAPSLAPTPPMGWNSWNSFATTITEAQALEVAAIQREKLLPFGYDVFTVDIQWYEPEASSYTYNPDPKPAMDAWGRLQPAPNRFPSAKDGTGFRALSGRIHSMGMKFGIHVMRGIPRRAVDRNLPVFGTKVRAADIADRNSICSWNPDMYGVDMRKPGAQAYYDSLFRMYADWGVDFVKMDDMSRPYDAHAAEIEAAALAIRRCGRPMILSLSPGETPVSRGDHVRRHAQMWRISDDFWDEWSMLEAQFTRLENWNPWRAPGQWPDPDMLPLGRLALGKRDTKFTPAEQRTLMTLWAITRAPLIMGGDLRHLDAPTLALLTNPAVIAVNQRSRDNQPHFLADGLRTWTATGASGERIAAFFNTGDKPMTIAPDWRLLKIPAASRMKDLWSPQAQTRQAASLRHTLEPHGCAMFATDG